MVMVSRGRRYTFFTFISSRGPLDLVSLGSSHLPLLSYRIIIITAEEYIFTDKELQEVLGALEDQAAADYTDLPPTTTTNSSGEEAPPSSTAALKLPKIDTHHHHPTSLSLQFQPHYDDTTTMDALPKIRNITTSSHHYFDQLKPTTTKYNPNHSVIEKQRRDRINSSIEALRKLVPDPSGDIKLNEKRAKHAVLSDAIHELKDLRRQLDAAQKRIAALSTGHGGGASLATTTTAFTNNSTENRTHSATANTTLLSTRRRHYDTNGNDKPSSRVHVEVEDGSDGGGPVVTVSCPDRRGLLADIVRTVRGLSLEISTASITTTRDGGVVDVFQCRQMTDSSSNGLDKEEICEQLKKCIESRHIGVKKKRTGDDGGDEEEEEERDMYSI